MRLTPPKLLAFLQKVGEHHYWTAEDYGSIPGDLIVEIYDGAVHAVPSATDDHQWVVGDLLAALCSTVSDRRLVINNFDVKVLGAIYNPDLVVLRARCELQPMPGEMLLAVFEVVSAGGTIERTLKKRSYSAQGVPLYVVVDGRPGAHFAEVYLLGDDGYELHKMVAADERVEFGEPFAFTLDMRQINR